MLRWILSFFRPRMAKRPASPRCQIRGGKFFFDGLEYVVSEPRSIEWLEQIVDRMLKLIGESGHPIIIESIRLEPYPAARLYTGGAITAQMIESAVPTANGAAFAMTILDAEYPVEVHAGTYYEGYEFIVSGHPEGLVWVRDVRDRLAKAAGETTF